MAVARKAAIPESAAPKARAQKTGGRKKGTPNKPKAVTAAAPAASVTGPAFPNYRIMRVDALIPYVNNARTHSAAQISKIAASVKEFGFTNPILTDGKRGIIAGHGRVLAAQKLGMETVPVIELAHLSAAQRRAYVLADNRLALDAGWDDELLALELGELRDKGFDLALTGFDLTELGRLFDEGDDTDSAAGSESAGGAVTCPKCGHSF